MKLSKKIIGLGTIITSAAIAVPIYVHNHNKDNDHINILKMRSSNNFLKMNRITPKNDTHIDPSLTIEVKGFAKNSTPHAKDASVYKDKNGIIWVVGLDSNVYMVDETVDLTKNIKNALKVVTVRIKTQTKSQAGFTDGNFYNMLEGAKSSFLEDKLGNLWIFQKGKLPIVKYQGKSEFVTEADQIDTVFHRPTIIMDSLKNAKFAISTTTKRFITGPSTAPIVKTKKTISSINGNGDFLSFDYINHSWDFTYNGKYPNQKLYGNSPIISTDEQGNTYVFGKNSVSTNNEVWMRNVADPMPSGYLKTTTISTIGNNGKFFEAKKAKKMYFISENGKLWYFNIGNNTFSNIYNNPTKMNLFKKETNSKILGTKNTHMYESSNGDVWIVGKTTNKITLEQIKLDGTVIEKELTDTTSFKSGQIFEDSKNRIWVYPGDATSDKTIVYDGSSWKSVADVSKNTGEKKFFEDKQGNVWLYNSKILQHALNSELVNGNYKMETHSTTTSPLYFNNKIIFDKNENAWGLNEKGLYVNKKTTINAIKTPEYSEVANKHTNQNIFHKADGKIVFSSDNFKITNDYHYEFYKKGYFESKSYIDRQYAYIKRQPNKNLTHDQIMSKLKSEIIDRKRMWITIDKNGEKYMHYFAAYGEKISKIIINPKTKKEEVSFNNLYSGDYILKAVINDKEKNRFVGNLTERIVTSKIVESSFVSYPTPSIGLFVGISPTFNGGNDGHIQASSLFGIDPNTGHSKVNYYGATLEYKKVGSSMSRFITVPDLIINGIPNLSPGNYQFSWIPNNVWSDSNTISKHFHTKQMVPLPKVSVPESNRIEIPQAPTVDITNITKGLKDGKITIKSRIKFGVSQLYFKANGMSTYKKVIRNNAYESLSAGKVNFKWMIEGNNSFHYSTTNFKRAADVGNYEIRASSFISPPEKFDITTISPTFYLGTDGKIKLFETGTTIPLIVNDQFKHLEYFDVTNKNWRKVNSYIISNISHKSEIKFRWVVNNKGDTFKNGSNTIIDIAALIKVDESVYIDYNKLNISFHLYNSSNSKLENGNVSIISNIASQKLFTMEYLDYNKAKTIQINFKLQNIAKVIMKDEGIYYFIIKPKHPYIDGKPTQLLFKTKKVADQTSMIIYRIETKKIIKEIMAPSLSPIKKIFLDSNLNSSDGMIEFNSVDSNEVKKEGSKLAIYNKNNRRIYDLLIDNGKLKYLPTGDYSFVWVPENSRTRYKGGSSFSRIIDVHVGVKPRPKTFVEKHGTTKKKMASKVLAISGALLALTSIMVEIKRKENINRERMRNAK